MIDLNQMQEEIGSIKNEKELEEKLEEVEQEMEKLSSSSEADEMDMFKKMIEEMSKTINLKDLDIVDMFQRINSDDENVLLSPIEEQIKELYFTFVNDIKEKSGGKITIVYDNREDIIDDEGGRVSTGHLFKRAISTVKAVRQLQETIEQTTQALDVKQLEKMAKKKEKVDSKRWRNVKNKSIKK